MQHQRGSKERVADAHLRRGICVAGECLFDGGQKDSNEFAPAEQCQERRLPRLHHCPAVDFCSRPSRDPGDQDNKLPLRRYCRCDLASIFGRLSCWKLL
jgi:hypothetical protein